MPMCKRCPSPTGPLTLVLSNLCIHNINSKNGREQACREIARVLKSGGKAIIGDAIHLEEYAEVFRTTGMTVEILRDGSSKTPCRGIKFWKPRISDGVGGAINYPGMRPIVAGQAKEKRGRESTKE